ncbi:PAC2 family protein [Candidatus Woesearchaeota archaeon]|nr:PAC2 family protein [Candidatus Woesearchaeota archaeon]
MWTVDYEKNAPKQLNKPILIEGLPGIGHVGKVAIDYIIDELKAKKLATFFSYTMPNSVFINEKNIVELPTIEMYYKKMKKQDLLLLAGDIQPLDEQSCYSFTDAVLDLFQKFSGSEVITTGGIGLSQVPKEPKIFCTGTNKEIIEKYSRNSNVKTQLHGLIGPIVGVSGTLLGVSGRRKIPAATLLVETLQHPLYLGVKEARELVKFLNERLKLGLDLKNLDKEIKQIEKEVMKKSQEFAKLQETKKQSETKSYIG